MLKSLALASALLCALTVTAQARHYHHRVASYAVDPGCNVIFPCEGVSASPRGERIVKAMGGFGSARQVYAPSAEVVAHPSGCPGRAFCGCGASVRIYGRSIRELWLAANWFRFPRTSPAPGMAAVRRHHVMVLEADLGGGVWRVYDANSGHGATRVHARSIAGYAIVNPHGAG